LVPLHILKVDGDAWEQMADTTDGMDKVRMSCAARSEFLGQLCLVKSALVVASHNNRSGVDVVEGADSFDCHQ